MHVIADLQLHSRFSRAVSPQMTIPFIAGWAARKGIGLVATGDWTHPMWFREIVANLEEKGNGLLTLKGKTEPYFLLATEVSCIYSQGGKLRRIHTLIWVPTIAAAEKINKELTRRGCNLVADGRPIIGLTSIQLAELVLSQEPKALLIPAHCLPPWEMILTSGFIPKRIDSVQEGDRVLTHHGVFRRVTEVMKRSYEGPVMTVQPWYFSLGLTTTPEHPFWAIRTLKKCPSTGDVCRPSASHLALCKRKTCLQYKPDWTQAKDLAVGDILVYPRVFTEQTLSNIQLSASLLSRKFFHKPGILFAGGTRGRKTSDRLKITPELGRLIGYYLAEGSTDGRNIAFCFSQDEQAYIDDVQQLMQTVFGIKYCRFYRRPNTKSVELTFSSFIHAAWLEIICYEKGALKRSFHKKLPDFLLQSEPSVQAECLRGWYRGDHGYTSSRVLVSHMKALCLALGIIPSILVDSKEHHAQRGNHRFGKRVITATHDSYVFANFAFWGDPFHLRKDIPRAQTKIARRHGWIDKKNIYVPIRSIKTKSYSGDVWNLEVAGDHSYGTEFAMVHNCWTPHFSVFGSASGFDSIAEAFGPFAKNIYAVETGLSSNPAMNWRIKELDNRSIVSFSDAHSGPKLGREATVFDLPNMSYGDIYEAIRTQKNIVYTIEFYPEEGKYHYTGHRTCGIRWSPEETKQKGTTCPVCGKPLTQGVMQRVEELASRSETSLQMSDVRYQISDKTKIQMTGSKTFPNRPPFVMLVPLVEILSEAIGSPVGSPKVAFQYDRLVSELDGEFSILLQASVASISHVAGERIAEGIDKVRRGDIVIEPGYDGVFGVVKIWGEGTKTDSSKEQLAMF